jgi:N-hydroxyarylamine O-acetyltransferase
VPEEGLPDALAYAYLDRLGVDVTRGEVDATMLAAILRAQTTRVPYENVDIYRGSPPGIEPVSCVERVVSGRGGYCYHQNGALYLLLRWLAVDATRHVSGVQMRSGAAPGLNANHMGISVRTPDGAEWLVDAGLGDGPAAPLALTWGEHEQDGFTYRLGPSEVDPDGWRFEHDPRLSFIGADFARAIATTDAFRAMHAELSVDPTSPFVRQVTVQRRVDGGVEILRGCVHSVVRADGVESRDLATEDDWWELVIDHVGLAYGDVPREERAEVWARIRESHEAWVDAGRP